MTLDKPALLTRRGEARDFLAKWRFGDWNYLRIRCVGAKPTITRVNGMLVAEIDLATIDHPHTTRMPLAAVLGRSGHLALEVHDTTPLLGDCDGVVPPRAAGAILRSRNSERSSLNGKDPPMPAPSPAPDQGQMAQSPQSGPGHVAMCEPAPHRCAFRETPAGSDLPPPHDWSPSPCTGPTIQ
jgi:hypothetical protein